MNIPLLLTYSALVARGLVGSQASQLAPGDHNHDGSYDPAGTLHDDRYAALLHDHDGAYEPLGTLHDGRYSLLSHDHNLAYSSLLHDHALVYEPLGTLHDDRYRLLSGSVDWTELTGVPPLADSHWKTPVATETELPDELEGALNGDIRITLDTDEVWYFDLPTSSWSKIGENNWASATHAHDYAALTNVPSEFVPAPHVHPYGELSGIPTEFTPSAHTHTALYEPLGTLHDGRYLQLYGGTLTGGLSFSPASGSPVIDSIRGMVFRIDSDSGSTTDEFVWQKDAGTQLMSLSEAGLLTIPSTTNPGLTLGTTSGGGILQLGNVSVQGRSTGELAVMGRGDFFKYNSAVFDAGVKLYNGYPDSGTGSSLDFVQKDGALIAQTTSRIGGILQETSVGSGQYRGALVFYTASNGNAAERMRINDAGYVGIGTTSPASPLHILRSDNLTSTDFAGVTVATTANPAAPSAFVHRGMQSSITGSLAGDLTNTDAGLRALQASASYTGSGNVSGMMAIGAYRSHSASAGTITKSYGLYVWTPGGASAVTTAYGVYIADQARTGIVTAYGVYQAGSTTQNLFAGVTTVSSIANPGFIVGDGSTGYLKIGGALLSKTSAIALNLAGNFDIVGHINISKGGADIGGIYLANTQAAANNNVITVDFKAKQLDGTSMLLSRIGGIITDTTNGAHHGALALYTASAGAAPTEKWRITSSGVLQGMVGSSLTLNDGTGWISKWQTGVPTLFTLANTYNPSAVGYGAGMQFTAVDSTNAQQSIAKVAGIMSSNTAGAVAADLVLYTMAASSVAERWRITSAGSLTGVSGSSVKSSAFTFLALTDGGSSGTAKTITWTASNKQKVTLSGNCTFTFTDPAGPCSIQLILLQDATGSRTVTWPASVKWAGGVAPTLTTTANKADIISFLFDGTNYFGAAALNF